MEYCLNDFYNKTKYQKKILKNYKCKQRLKLVCESSKKN